MSDLSERFSNGVTTFTSGAKALGVSDTPAHNITGKTPIISGNSAPKVSSTTYAKFTGSGKVTKYLSGVESVTDNTNANPSLISQLLQQSRSV